MENDICLCGHRKFFHLNESCAVCGEMWFAPEIMFHKYKADNLRYLELKYENSQC